MTDLDEQSAYRELDPEDMYRRVGDLAGQIAGGWDATVGLTLPRSYREVRNVLVAGMGGSAIGGSLLEAYAGPEFPVPLVVSRSYGVPGWVDEQTLFIAVSYSGNTEETLAALRAARARNARIVVVSTGGEISRLAGEWAVPAVSFTYQAQPRAALGHLFMPLLRVAEALGFVAPQETAVRESVSVVRRAAMRWDRAVRARDNPAKTLALALRERAAVVYGAEFLGAVARRWKTQLNENAKLWAFYEEYSELNHNAIVGYRFPTSFADSVYVVTLDSPLLADRQRVRMGVTDELMDRYGVPHCTVEAEGAGVLAQMMYLVALGDFVSYYQAIVNGANPTEIAPINHLKDALARA